MKHLNLFIQSVIMLNGCGVSSKQFLIMLKSYFLCEKVVLSCLRNM